MRRHILMLLFIGIASLYAKQNINYAKSELHTLTPKKGTLEFELNMLMMNDTIDILKIKEKEFGNNSNFDSIGNLEGFDLGLQYSIFDNLMVSTRYTSQEIEYSSSTLENTRLEMYARYHVFQNKSAFFSSGISVDFGYISNQLKDFYIRDLDTIQQSIKSVFNNLNGTISKLNDTTLKYVDSNNFRTDFHNPYIALTNTKDESYYLRFLTGFSSKNSYTDFYAGIKTTAISNTMTSTQEVINAAASQNITIPIVLDRDEKSVFAGFNYTLDTNPLIYEFNYEYEHFFRDEGLDYINNNHTINASIAYALSKSLLLTTSATIMYRQLNGQIPYLYNKYTQTSYDHKYGYASFGIIYNFN